MYGTRNIVTSPLIRDTTTAPVAWVATLIWSYQDKRRPDGSLLKYKSCICANSSGMQEQGCASQSFMPQLFNRVQFNSA